MEEERSLGDEEQSLEDEEERLDDKAFKRKAEDLAGLGFKPIEFEFFDGKGESIEKQSWEPAKWATGHSAPFWRMVLRELKALLPATQQDFPVLYIQDRTTKVTIRTQSIY